MGILNTLFVSLAMGIGTTLTIFGGVIINKVFFDEHNFSTSLLLLSVTFLAVGLTLLFFGLLLLPTFVL